MSGLGMPVYLATSSASACIRRLRLSSLCRRRYIATSLNPVNLFDIYSNISSSSSSSSSFSSLM
uniref:Uncharacterized protein n=1 Tax=Arundo donax TaxID=35708 RepID=A0A0A9GQR0_ARUDO